MKLILPKYTTLARVVLTATKYTFYSQEWYMDEDFAHEDVGGEWTIPDDYNEYLLPAGVWVYAHSSLYGGGKLRNKFVWTDSYDRNGDQVYVGHWDPKGFQIHRHLTISAGLFLNKGKF